MTRRRLALTVGDAAGVGPEVVLRLAAEGDVPAPLLLVGDAGALERARAWVASAPPIPEVARPDGAHPAQPDLVLWSPGPRLDPLPPPGRAAAAAGRASFEAVRAAVRLARSGTVGGLVTGPIHKAAWRRAGVPHPGHTEMLAAECGVERALMLLVGGGLRVALATVHVALAAVPALVTRDGLLADLRLLHAEMARWFAISRPRIAVAGLNPHAGEGGLFGGEEAASIAPAVAAARALGIEADGPLPADACIPAAAAGTWDVVLAMYHDQALPAVKALAPRRAVNVTLGLPFARTSVDHGTAFDIAGTGRASATSLREAVSMAAGMCERQARSGRGS